MGSLLVISGPSGSGKTSLAKEILIKEPNSYFSISTTTRAPRDGEQNGVDYFFISKEEFLEQIKDNQFLEWAEVFGNYYGTSLKPIKEALLQKKLVLFDIDVQGHNIIREKFGSEITSVFVTTPNLSVLKNRLEARKTDSEAQINKRINNAIEEMGYIKEYDYILINDVFSECLDSLFKIASVAKYKCAKLELEEFIASWQSK